MATHKQGEEAIISEGFNETEQDERDGEGFDQKPTGFKNFLWHGGSVYDAWFSCASNQVAQVLLTLPYSFSQLGMLSGVILQVFYGILGSWTAYLISVLYVEYRTRKEKENVSFKNHVIQWFEVLDGLLGPHWKAVGLAFNCTFLLFGSVIQLIACASNIYYVNDHLDKRTWTYIFGACCATTVFVPSFHNYRIWSFLGLGMTTYTAWYLTIAALVHGQVEGVIHSGPKKLVLYFTGATNILYTFGGHAVTVEIMHAMWKPQKFKYIYLFATLYVFTLTIPSAAAVYWAFGDQLLNRSNAFSLLPRTGFRDAAVILMLIHQFITFGFACTPLYFVWEKVVGMHETKSICLRALARLPVVIPIWFLAIIFPFFGPINSAVGALLVSFTVYIIPALAHMLTYRKATARQNAAEKPPFFLPSWSAMYVVNHYGAQQMYKSVTARYVSAERYSEALDILQAGACIQLEHEQVICGAELAVLFVENLVKAKVLYDVDSLDRVRKIYEKFPRIPVPQHVDLADDDMQRISEALGAAKTRVESCSSFLKAAIRWSTEFGAPRNGSPEIHDMLAEYIYSESPEVDMARVSFHFVRGKNPEKFASTLVNFMGKCYPGEDDLAIARAVLMYLSLGNLRDANYLMDEVKKQVQSKELDFPQSNLIQFINYLLQTLLRDSLPLFNMLRQNYASSIDREPTFNELLDVVAEKFYGVRRKNPLQDMFGDIFKMMGGDSM